MAGDWIKVEKVTPDKPEIAILARQLGVSQAEAFLTWFRAYAWADGITATGNVPNLSLSDGDTLSRCCPGTFQSLASEEIGWVAYDGSGLVFADWERHNGKSAKSRAVEADKKRRQRKEAKKRPGDNGTKSGPEKRREEYISPTPFSIEELVAIWNGLPGVRKVREITDDRRQALAKRWKESAFRENYQAAFAKFPLKCFSDDEGWKPELDWFLRKGQVTHIIEGKFDWSKNPSANGSKATSSDPAPKPYPREPKRCKPLIDLTELPPASDGSSVPSVAGRPAPPCRPPSTSRDSSTRSGSGEG